MESATPAVDAREAYAEAVLDVVERIPPGLVCSYGDVAEIVGRALGRGGPRMVGQVMARHGGAVPWWRVVRADGRPAAGHEGEAIERLVAEGAVLVGHRVDLRRSRWRPDADEIAHELASGPGGTGPEDIAER